MLEASCPIRYVNVVSEIILSERNKNMLLSQSNTDFVFDESKTTLKEEPLLEYTTKKRRTNYWTSVALLPRAFRIEMRQRERLEHWRKREGPRVKFAHRVFIA